LYNDLFIFFYTGDCWFLASIGSLTFQQDILEKVLPIEQTFNEKYCGIFHFRVNTNSKTGYYMLLIFYD